MKRWLDTIRNRERLWLFLKSFGLFLLLFLALASAALHNIIATESNPFFYACF
jgi:hypothetical protein